MTGDELRMWREGLGLTQAQAAVLLGVSRVTINRQESSATTSARIDALVSAHGQHRPTISLPIVVPSPKALVTKEAPTIKATREKYGRPIGFDVLTGEPIYAREAGASRHGKVSKGTPA